MAFAKYIPQAARISPGIEQIASALARREREQLLGSDQVETALATVRDLSEGWYEIAPSVPVRRAAERLLHTHPLRAADSLQLAAALIAASHDPATLEFVGFDARLASAARREGFTFIDS